jgi:hypothetical protein
VEETVEEEKHDDAEVKVETINEGQKVWTIVLRSFS